jgi:hypothetical protein
MWFLAISRAPRYRVADPLIPAAAVTMDTRQRFPHGSGELADPLISLLDREGWTGEAGTTLPAFAKAGALDEPQRTQLAARLAPSSPPSDQLRRPK